MGYSFSSRYFNFFVNNINAILGTIGLQIIQPRFDVLLSVGISFYTFQALGYIVDAYRGEKYAGWYFVVATMLFAFQIYGDFSGYSTIAIGASKMLEIDLMENFDTPYFSQSVSEFWRRWHISFVDLISRLSLYTTVVENKSGRCIENEVFARLTTVTKK